MKQILAVPLLSIGLSLPAMTLGSEIGPGFDLFETTVGTQVTVPGIGTIPLEGNPDLLASEGLGNTDTIVERKQGINPLDPPNGEGTVDIELVALSLKSINALDIGPLGFPAGTMADLYVTVNTLGLPDLPQPCPLPPSTGSMTIKHTNDDGGTFESELEVYVCLIFVIAGGDISKTSDWLLVIDGPVTVLIGVGKWSHHGAPRPPKYPAGKFYIIVIIEKAPPENIHQVKPIGICVLDFDVPAPPNQGVGAGYLNNDGVHFHSIKDQPDPVELERFVSCYEKIVPREACDEGALETTKPIWYPRPNGQNATITSTHWFEDAKSCDELRKLGILPRGAKLQARDVTLNAVKNGNQVDLTLTTSAEPDSAEFIIIRGTQLDNGGTDMDINRACRFAANGGPSYTCTDDVVGDDYRVVEIENDGDLILYDKVKP